VAPLEEVERPRNQVAAQVDGAVEIEKHGFHAIEARVHIAHALSFAARLISLPPMNRFGGLLEVDFFVLRSVCCKEVYALSAINVKWRALTRIAQLAEE
jgi:hypothetical protein